MSKKMYGIESQEFDSLKKAKDYVRWFYGPNVNCIIHYGIKDSDGNVSFNEGKKYTTTA